MKITQIIQMRFWWLLLFIQSIDSNGLQGKSE